MRQRFLERWVDDTSSLLEIGVQTTHASRWRGKCRQRKGRKERAKVPEKLHSSATLSPLP
jgi:hypothetical protein